jgi:hypothetical protein
MSIPRKEELTYDYFDELLNYDKESGKLYWKSKSSPYSRIIVGEEAGCIRHYKTNSYRIVVLKNTPYFVHRIIWLLVHKKWPDDQIDHIDGNSLNNKIQNLKSASNQENCRNQRKRLNNTTGHPNIYWHTGKKKYSVSLRFNGKLNHIKDYQTLEEAIIGRDLAWTNYCKNIYSERHSH